MPPIQNTITDNSKLSKPKERAQLSHALIDVDFFDKPKIKALNYKYGQLASLLLIRILMSLSRATDAEIDLDAARCIGHEVGLGDKTDEVLDYLFSHGLLTHVGNTGVTQERVIADQESCASKRRKWRDEKKEAPPEYPPESVPESGGNSEQLNTEDLKIEDPREGGSKGETIDLGHGIKLDPMSMDALKLEFARFGLKPLWIGRAAAYCATQNNEKYKNGPYLYLSTWGIQRCLEEKDKIERCKNTENIGKKYDPGPKRPATMSPARPETTGPPSANPQVRRLVEGLTKSMPWVK